MRRLARQLRMHVRAEGTDLLARRSLGADPPVRI
jgi:hypothetical protein